ncbi:hypothetical protein KAU45_10035 [bacterium]|nr:hypothetical protein [bacterium]
MRETNELLFAGGSPVLIIGEWIPFGSNYIDLFSRKIRPSYAPVGSTFLTEEIDTRPGEPTFEIQAPPTEIIIRETVRGKRVSLSARLGYLETGGEIQDERVGVQLDVFGRVIFAAGLASVKGRRERISLDSLSPVIADLTRLGRISEDDIIAKDARAFRYTYPFQTAAAERVRLALRDELARRGVHLAGRYARWEYLHMDQAIAQGFEAADACLAE